MLRWATTLGLVGFLAGFAGPIVLNEGNQGPMTGLFITGPGGALLGLGLGWLAMARGWSQRRNAQVLWSSAALSCALILYACLPQPRVAGDLVAGEIRACLPAQQFRQAAVLRLRAAEAGRPRPSAIDWGGKFDNEYARTPGIVVTMHGGRARRLVESQAPWSRGDLKAGAWTPLAAETSYFVAHGACAAHAPGRAARLLVRGLVGVWPPAGLAEMLDMRSAEFAPAEYAGLAAAP